MKINETNDDRLRNALRNRRSNSAYQPRIEGYRWNISQISKALNFDRATIRKRLKAAGIQPEGRVHGTDVFEMSRAIPVLFGAEPREPKECR